MGGENGGRSCYFVPGTYCCGFPHQSLGEKQQQCHHCSFFQLLSEKHGYTYTAQNFNRYVSNSESRVAAGYMVR
ncbi:MAG: hypothetical protein HQL67_02835 [Magnetococcales bacterium]|nr:hypothetical protein [Magnetococcales bacterium]